MKQVVTFILPTRNRKHFVRRAIESCLACESEIVSPCVIVIDGESDDGTFGDLTDAYGRDPRVTLLQNSKSSGFMKTCFEGVELVKSRWVTFMYDDDVLSPFFVNMVGKLSGGGGSFVMGYGAEHDVDKVYPFKPVDAYKDYSPMELLFGHYGHNQGIDFKGLPVSPICCITTIERLHEWTAEVTRFGSRNAIRRYFMLQRNIGPDLMIYLLSLLRQTTAVPVAAAVVAEFSVHPGSMSIQYGSSELQIGYWLAKIWAFESLCRAGLRREAAICGSALFLVGVRMLIARLSRFKVAWSGRIIAEISGVLWSTIKSQILLRTIMEGYWHVVHRLRPSSHQLIPT